MYINLILFGYFTMTLFIIYIYYYSNLLYLNLLYLFGYITITVTIAMTIYISMQAVSCSSQRRASVVLVETSMLRKLKAETCRASGGFYPAW